jgi:hypothetical protein
MQVSPTEYKREKKGSGIEDIDTTVKENTRYKKLLIQNIQEIQDT